MARRPKPAPSAKRRRAVPLTGFAAALESAAKHTRTHERRSRAAKRGWEKRRYREKHGPPKAVSVLDVAREFDSPQAAVDFARRNLIPPHEWADDLADEFDLDTHPLYEGYYDTDPATQGALA